jgi:hypothetical protein
MNYFSELVFLQESTSYSLDNSVLYLKEQIKYEHEDQWQMQSYKEGIRKIWMYFTLD